MTNQSTGDRAAALRQAIRLKRAAARSPMPQMARRPADQKPQLGELQRSLWLQHQLQPDSAAYNLTQAFRVPGKLRIADLDRALNQVVARHRLLRSTFLAQHDNVLQVVHPHTAFEVEELTADAGEALTTAVVEAGKPFDLANGPLLRLLFIEERETAGSPGLERLLVLVLHHILADERSLGFFWKELASGYAGQTLDTSTEQPQYDDYVYWSAQQDRQPRSTELTYWQDQLDPLPDDLLLPFEAVPFEAVPFETQSFEPLSFEPLSFEERTADSVSGRLLSRPLGIELSRQIKQLAASTGTTPFVVCAFAFRLMLQRYTEDRNIAFATPVSKRSHAATAEMIGYFLNPVVICLSIDETQTVEQALVEFNRPMRQAMANASIPFDQLIEALSPPRQRDRHPVFQSMFVYQETPAAPRLGDVQLEPVVLDLGISKFDLTLFASEQAGALDIAVEYRTDRFDDPWMGRLLDHYATLLGNLAANHQIPTTMASMLSAEESDALRLNARGPRLDAGLRTGSVHGEHLPQQILHQVRRSPRATALADDDASWSYKQLGRVAQRIANELTRRGVVPGDRVGLYVERSPLMIASLLGCHWAGAAYVPLDPAYPSARNHEVLEDAQVAAILSHSTVQQLLPQDSVPILDVDALRQDALLPTAQDSAGDNETSGVAVPDIAVPDLVLSDLDGELPAYILYTSGSTGRPKGVVVSHANLTASNDARLQFYDTSPKRFLLLSSVAFDSSVVGIFWTLASGGTLVIPSDDQVKDPRQLSQLIEEQQVTTLLCVPSLYAHLLGAGEHPFSDLETVIVAGESCPPQLVEEHFRRHPQTRLFNEYGPTEATVWTSVHEIERQESARSVAIGRPIPGVQVDVLDSFGRPVPAGVPGEGWISGPTLAGGYWQRSQLTDERFVRRGLVRRSLAHRSLVHPAGQADADAEERMYRSGDRLMWTTDGRLQFLGRVDEQIKLRGFRIEPGDIEAALLAAPHIEAAAVVVRPPSQLVAFIVTSVVTSVVTTGMVTTDDGLGDSTQQQLQELAQRLPEFMVPARIVELPELPHLPNGKIDRRRLGEMPLDAESPATDDRTLLSDLQQALISLWEGLLGHSGINLTDNFFQLGGHSLLVVEMASAIEQDFAVKLSPADVFQHPTVQGLSQLIEQQGGPSVRTYAHLFPLQPGGHRSPLIFSVPHFFSHLFASRFRGERPVYGLRGVSLRAEGNRGRWPTLRDLGEDLVEEILQRFPDESFVMVGYSFGASMAVEAVRLMEERGIAVKRLILIAPMPLDFYSIGPFRVRIDRLRQPVEELSSWQALIRLVRTNHPFCRGLYQRLWRLLTVQPWRWLLCQIGRWRTLVGLPLTAKILHADVRLERFRLHRHYRPGILRTPTIIFNAKEPETDAAATWRPYFAGPLTVHPIPDPHLDEDSIAAAKELISQHLHDLGEA